MPQMSPIMWTLQIIMLLTLLATTKANLPSKKETEKTTQPTTMMKHNPTWKW